MSIVEIVILPAQPISGEIEYIPLAGDGFTAPRSAFYGSVLQTGDASGGTIRMTVKRDQRFEHVISFLTAEVLQTSAAGVRFAVGRANTTINTVGATKANTITGDAVSALTYAPVAMIEPTFFELDVENTEDLVWRFKFLIYNFNVQASFKVPLSILLASLPRAPTIV